MQQIDLLLHSAAQLCTIADLGAPQRGRDLAQSWLAEVAAIEADVEQMVNEIAATAAQRGGF